MSKGVLDQGLVLLVVGGLFCFAPSGSAQSLSTFRHRPQSDQTRSPIRVESNLVLIPTFVFYKDRISRITTAESECWDAEWKVFLNLPASVPFSYKSCYASVVQGLRKDDFRLFDDGVAQTFDIAADESEFLTIRDNMGWHLGTSITPSGVWSSTDLAKCRMGWDSFRFYLIAYAPSNSEVDKCHKIEVKVDRPGTRVFARDEYCGGQSPSDPLYGTKGAKQLERDLASGGRGKIPLYLGAGAFASGNDPARLDIVLEFPWNRLHHDWDTANWTLWARIGVLGIVYRKNGTLAARFSDLLYPSYWPTFEEGQLSYMNPPLFMDQIVEPPPSDPATISAILSRQDPALLPTRYETQIGLPPGDYDLKVVLSDEQKFGRAEMPLHIERQNGRELALSSIMLCKRYRDAHVAAVEAAAEKFAPQHVPLVSKGAQFTPTGDTRFKKGEPLIPYFEVYEPLLAVDPKTKVEAHLKILDANTGKLIKDFPPVDATPYERTGSSTIPIAREVPFEQLPKGSYQLAVQVADSAGRSTSWHSASFTITADKE